VKKLVKKILAYIGKFLRIYGKLNLPKFIYKHMSFDGVFKIHLSNQSILLNNYQDYIDEVSNDIFYSGIFGNYEGESLRIWSKLCAKAGNSIVLDIGAYTGIYSLVAASTNKNIEIHSFEPHPQTFKYFMQNMNLNRFKNIFPHNFALSKKDGKEIFYNSIGICPSGFSNLNHKYINPAAGQLKCRTMSVSTLFKKEISKKRISLIKIDVERGELLILKSMLSRILADKATVLCEILDEENYPKFDKLFYDNGFKIFMIDDANHKIVQLDCLNKKPKIARNVLFIPCSEVINNIY